jgi:hypothetical protein
MKLLFLIVLSSCSYSFRGALPADLKSIYIEKVSNKVVSRDFSNELTNKIVERFISDNNLSQVSKDKADIFFEATIEGFSDNEVLAISGSNNTSPTADRYKVYISINIICTNAKTNKKFIEETILKETQIQSSASIADKEQAIQFVLDEVSEAVVDKVIGYW